MEHARSAFHPKICILSAAGGCGKVIPSFLVGWKLIRACATLCLHRVFLMIMEISFLQNRLFYNLTRCTTLL